MELVFNIKQMLANMHFHARYNPNLPKYAPKTEIKDVIHDQMYKFTSSKSSKKHIICVC